MSPCSIYPSLKKEKEMCTVNDRCIYLEHAPATEEFAQVHDEDGYDLKSTETSGILE